MKKRNKMKRIGSVILAAAMVMGLVSGCGGSKSDKKSEGSDREDVIVGYHIEPATLDPNNMSDGGAFCVTAQIFEGLLWLTDDLEIEPMLAKSWEISEDGLTYTFHLEEDVKFQNGEPLTAEDVKFSYERAMEGGFASSVTDIIDTMEAKDEHTFVVVLKYPYQPALECFASHMLRVVSKKVVEEAGDSFSYNPIDAGTGPYKFVSWESGNNIKLEANENYWREAPKIKQAEIRFLTDQTTLSSALEAGDVDAGTIAVSDVTNYENNPNMECVTKASTVFNFVGFNNAAAPFDDARVRQAIAYSCDTKELVLSAFDSEVGGTSTATPVPSTGFGYNEELDFYPKDVEKAKALLKEAGLEDGFETTIYTPNNTPRKNIATYLQACMADIGIKANIEVMEQAAVQDEIRAGNCPMFIIGYTGTAGDADFFYYANFHSDQTFNYSKYSNAEVDSLLDKARMSSDESERTGLYKDVSEIIYNDMPVMPTYFMNQLWGFSSDLNSTISATGRFYIYDWSWK